MVDQVGRDRELAEPEWLPVAEECRRSDRGPGGVEEPRGIDDRRRLAADVDRDARGHLVDESVMVEMRVSDEHSAQVRVRPVPQPGHIRQIDLFSPRSGQWLSHIEDDTIAMVFDLDAGAADLVAPAMDAHSHGAFPR